jgi:hypothetical protein
MLCTDLLGNRIGVELTEWLDQEQTRDFSRWEDILRDVTFPGDWTINVRLNPFACYCRSGEQKTIAVELSRVIAEKSRDPMSGRPAFSRLSPAARISGTGHRPPRNIVIRSKGTSLAPDAYCFCRAGRLAPLMLKRPCGSSSAKNSTRNHIARSENNSDCARCIC